MTVSALFEIKPGAAASYGTAGVAQDVDSAGDTVTCRVADSTGVVSVVWTIFGTHGAAAPTITGSTSLTMSFPVPAGAGQAYGIQCVTRNAAGETDTRTSAVYVPYSNGERPFFVGETFERDASYAIAPTLNQLLGSSGVKVIGQGSYSATGGEGTVALVTDTPTDEKITVYILEASAVDTAGDDALYIRRYVVSRASGTVTAKTTRDIHILEDDATWDFAGSVSTPLVSFSATVDGTNNSTWQYFVSKYEYDLPT